MNKRSYLSRRSSVRQLPRPRFRPRLEELEPRTLLTSTFYWDPTSGSAIDANQVINGVTYYLNWDTQFGLHTHPTSLPTSTDNVVFDGSSGYNGHGQYYNGNAPVTVDVNLSGNIFLQNGFNATITINDGMALTCTSYTDNNIGTDDFVVTFGGSSAALNFGATGFVGSVDTMGNFLWHTGGKANVAAGNSVFIGSKAGLSQSTSSPLYISGTVGIGPSDANSGTSTFYLTNDSADITVNANGGLNLFAPTAAATLVDNTGTTAWINNNGTVSLVNSPGGSQAIIGAPLENHATLNANQSGSWGFGTPDQSGNDLSMDAGTITLQNTVLLGCSHGYTQTGGTLRIADNQSESLLVSTSGTTNFNGGKIVFNSASGYGTLWVNNVIFNGVEIDMRIDGTTNASDEISCLGGTTCDIQGNSKLVVTAVHNVVRGNTWTLITSNAPNAITGDFLVANMKLPPNTGETGWVPPRTKWQCNS
jgi:hypothetical protein